MYSSLLLVQRVRSLKVLVNKWSKVSLILHWLFSLGLLAFSEGSVSNFDISIEALSKCLIHILMLLIEYNDSILLLTCLVYVITC